MLLAMVMLIGITPAMMVSAELTTTTLDSALSGYWNWSGSSWKVAGKRAEIVAGAGVDGGAALHVVGNSATGNVGNSFQVVSKTQLTAGNTYQVSLYAKNVTNLQNAKVCFGTWAQEALDVNASNAESMGDGWYKFTFERAVSANIDFAIICYTDTDSNYTTYEEIEFYVDKVSIVNTADNSEVLSYFAANFENEPEPEVVLPTPTGWTALEEGWTASYKTEAVLDNVRHSKIAEGVSYSGDRSLHIKFNPTTPADATNIQTVHPTVVSAFDATKTYNLSFYALGKVTDPSKVYVSMGWKTGSKKTMDTWTVEDPEDAAKKAAGWKKYTTTLTNTHDTFRFVTHYYAAELFIDDITLIDEAAPTVNIFDGEMGTFEDPATIVPGTALTTTTTDPALSGYWGYNSNAYKIAGKTVEIVADGGFDSSAGLHIVANSLPTDTDSAFQVVAQDKLTEGHTYDVTFYAKNVKNMGQVKIACGNYTQNALDVTASNAEDMGDGWYKFTFEKTYSNNNALAFIVYTNTDSDYNTYEEVEFYVDKVSIVDQADSSEVMSYFAANFEEKPVVLPTPTELIALEQGWTASYKNEAALDNARHSKIAKGVSYSGDRSLHIKFNPVTPLDATNIQSVNSIVSSFDASKTYNLSFYMLGKVTDPSKVYVSMGWKTGAKKTMDQWVIEDPEDATKKAEGWKKCTVTLTNTHDTFRFVTHYYAAELFIDDITLIDSAAPTVNIFDGPIGTFEEPVIERPVDALSTSYLDPALQANWRHNTDATGVLGKSITLDTEVSYAGLNSMHVVANSSTEDTQSNFQINGPEILETGKTYTVSFYAKDVKNLKNVAIWYGGYSQKVLDTTNTSIATAVGNGWYKFTFPATQASNNLKFGFIVKTNTDENDDDENNGYEEVEFYIDNISVVESTGNTDIYAGFQGTFEEETTKAWTVGEVKLYDGTTKLDALSDAQSGKTLTSKVRVANWNGGNSFTAQLLVCVYNGYQLEKANISTVTTIANNGGVGELTADIQLPTFAQGGDYTVKVYVWDSLAGMTPLLEDVAEF